ncbi:conserved protein of unknown function [Tepidanaerobacter acetatoxydans Re1]|uniref:DUF7768 domain-containing protein n=1 Tax=Tepidanaerobacter acetatoxydans (strain DSM 21804 / JCM 16047 / Re1) TaxID=1209989 RepID=F4LTU4_TEPAE|nr:DUF3310 domain-containing protein [Tepidanaerobacter acetatoxydans]AEE92541.1 hypothetical protein TepRe1_2440 [Tepidanaerobacter acetatoxydans Re1]CCP27491.1 conserved protein of unknown function [Tepidanaerobacter acetatoxydans Re1]
MDKINPDHYKTGGIETIDFIKAKLTGEQFKGYLAGNVIKYLSRFEHKAGEEDLQKARWYLNRLLLQRKRPIIYVCSPLRGDIDRNIHKAIGYCRYIYSRGGIPLAPHVIFTTFLDDAVPEERAAGIELGLEVLSMCDELWAFGEKISEGMSYEITRAKKLGIRMRRFNERCKPLEVVAGDARGD